MFPQLLPTKCSAQQAHCFPLLIAMRSLSQEGGSVNVAMNVPSLESICTSRVRLHLACILLTIYYTYLYMWIYKSRWRERERERERLKTITDRHFPSFHHGPDRSSCTLRLLKKRRPFKRSGGLKSQMLIL